MADARVLRELAEEVVCRSCGGSGWRLVMRKGRATFRRHGSCGAGGLRRARGNRLGPAMYASGRRALAADLEGTDAP